MASAEIAEGEPTEAAEDELPMLQWLNDIHRQLREGLLYQKGDSEEVKRRQRAFDARVKAFVAVLGR